MTGLTQENIRDAFVSAIQQLQQNGINFGGNNQNNSSTNSQLGRNSNITSTGLLKTNELSPIPNKFALIYEYTSSKVDLSSTCRSLVWSTRII